MSEEYEQKIKNLSTQLDKLTTDFLTLQEKSVELKLQLEEKKHSEQMGAWAIDRAIETFKLSAPTQISAQDVIDFAECFTAWIMESSSTEEKPNVH